MPWRAQSRYNFVIENPLDGALWQLPCIDRLLERSAHDEPNGLVAKFTPTSYCHYGSASQKRTGFLTTLNDAHLARPCPSHPCALAADDASRHKAWETVGKRDRNAIPIALIDEFLKAWVAKAPLGKTLVLIDVFAGYGSVRTAVEGWNDAEKRTILYVDNDILRSCAARYDLDMQSFGLTVLECLALNQRELQREETSVLFWLSPPCTTYSVAGLHKHRPKGEDISPLASDHDALVEKVFTELHALIHDGH